MGIESMDQGARVRNFVFARLSRSRAIVLGLIALFLTFYVLSPYDSSLRSTLRWQSTVASDYVQHLHPDDKWLFKEQKYPIDPSQDIAVIVKTGFGTRNRVPNVLAALGNETLDNDVLIIQDYPVNTRKPYITGNAKTVETVDIISWMVQNHKLADHGKNERLMKYEHLVDAIEDEDYFMADTLAKGYGWELDAMKFISGLQYAWEKMPKKKWYVMSDDDTYVIKSSLALALGHLDYRVPQYLGNPVGDFLGRFAHGGSSAVISGATMAKLFDKNPAAVTEAHIESISAVYGDKLLSTTLMKIGIYLNEDYARLFNGEPPHMTRMWADRFCLPLVSFHGLGDGDLMEETNEHFKHMNQPVFWRQLASIYGAADFQSFVAEPVRVNLDFVGRLDEHSTTVVNTETLDDCVRICGDHSTECLAWTWDQFSKTCHYAPWAIIGDHREGFLSGINYALAQKLTEGCHGPRSPAAATE
ncbi:hypothetical protein PFICI_00128 [Pestalotiopsis fici W106-1]|uniref:Apple domain-containing protein n=1 Tax=Pestalotiopsis fici (strain W106-1 / CGMCC3.15140) TaxID=1229662 RepID=W3XJX5_PESFW|nr:uncharacterized protein PFICI_00128 [Pestalotiopsis fici W106-1]ETS86300.1 hypothetical protein PFICI_00128 [Pestalotiopsis fici W106-1]